MGIIHLEGMEFYAYHGHFKEEQQVGNKFMVDVKLTTDIEKAAKTDDLSDALDYLKVYETIAVEMKIKSQLLENLTFRMAKRLFLTFPSLEYLELKVSKMNPPLGGRVEKVTMEWNGNRETVGKK
jgi:dihydroneopterin aldolase